MNRGENRFTWMQTRPVAQQLATILCAMLHRFRLTFTCSLLLVGYGVTQDIFLSRSSQAQQQLPLALNRAARSANAPTTGPEFAPGEVLVKYRRSADTANPDLEALRRARHRLVEQKFRLYELGQNERLEIHTYQLAAGQDVSEAVTALSNDPAVEFAEPNYYRHLMVTPNDPYYANFRVSSGTSYPNSLQRWVFNGSGSDRNVNGEAAWDLTTGRSEVVIAVIDSGVLLNHPDLLPNIWRNPGETASNGVDDDRNGFVDDVFGWDFRGNTHTGASRPDNNPNPDLGDGLDNDNNDNADDTAFHGTFVAGVATARGNDGQGIAGACWNCRVMALKVFTDDGAAKTSDIADAITYAASNGASIINLSLGASTPSQTDQAAINFALSRGLVVIASAGNGDSAQPNYPASFPGVLSVGATDWGGDFPFNGTANNLRKRAPYSQYGSQAVDVVAPGTVLSISFYTRADEQRGEGQAGAATVTLSGGTSFSAPLVAGMAGLMLSHARNRNVTLTNTRVVQLIEDTAIDLPDDPTDSPNAGSSWDNHGRVDMRAALNAITSGTPTPTPTPGSTTEVLAVDDGTLEGGLVANGLLVVNRLTPASYPSRLQTIRIYFTQYNNQPNPGGAQIRVLAANVSTNDSITGQLVYVFDQMATLPTNPNGFIDFNLPNGPMINNGDWIIGFQAPNPFNGVVCPTDRNSTPQNRSFSSVNNGLTFQPLTASGQPVNAMIRALVLNSTGPSCSYSLLPTNQNFAASGGTGSLIVATDRNCAWMATSNNSFITITNGASGNGPGFVGFSVAANSSNNSRSGTLTVAGQTFTVTQTSAPSGTPAISLSPTSLDFSQVNLGASASRQLTIRNTGTATLILNSISSDNGQFRSGISVSNFALAPGGLLEGSINFTPTSAGVQQGRLLIQSNDPAQPTAVVQLRGEGFNPQAACPTITNLTPASGRAGTAITITGTNFSGVSEVRFGGNALATFTLNAAGTQIAATVPANAQTGQVIVSKPNCPAAQSQPFTVLPNCSFSISPANQTVPASGGAGTVNVTAPSGCNWIATSNAPFITLNNSGGNGNGTVGFNVTANTAFSPRSGTLTIAGQTFTVQQDGAAVNTNRVVRTLDASGAPGEVVRVPIVIEAQGDEVGVQFSLSYNPLLLSEPQAEAGSDAANNQFFDVNLTQASQGRVGVLLLLRTALPAGTRQIAVVRLRLAASVATGQRLPLEFINEPTRQRVIDINTNALPANFQAGVLSVGTGFEGDVNDDKVVDIADAQLVINLLAGRRPIQSGAEFQRADCAPKASKGDGLLDLSDVRQALLYATTSELITAGGPLNPQATAPFLTAAMTETTEPDQNRVVRLGAVSGVPGTIVSIPIWLDAQGDEVGIQFSLNYAPSLLGNPQVVAGSDATNYQFLDVNTTQIAQGRLGVLLLLRTPLPRGMRQLAVLRFQLASNATQAPTLSFGQEPVRQRIINSNADVLPASFEDGSITLQRPVATVSAASFAGGDQASEAIVAAFGLQLATRTEIATSLPLPTTLAGTTVRVRDSTGVERLAPLFFVAPGQINYQVPANSAVGAATVIVTSGDGTISTGPLNLVQVAPGLLAANANGQGVAAAVAVRLRADGSQRVEAVAQFDSGQNRFVPLPLELGPETEQVFLILFGTGLRFHRGLNTISVQLGGVETPVTFAGAQGEAIGLDQVNVRLPRTLAGRGEVELRLRVEGREANPLRLNIK